MIAKNLKHKPILVMDSGVGGLTVLHTLIDVLPKERYIFFADFDNAPYGNLSIKKLQSIVLDRVSLLYQKYQPKCLILACNTATAGVIYQIREKFSDCIVVGTEPAIKPALKYCKKVLVLATKGTIQNSGLLKLASTNKSESLELLALPELAKLIEQNIENLDLILPYLNEKLQVYVGKVDGIVLGCTHYLFIKHLITKIFGEDVKIFDGNIGVAKRVQSCLNLLNLEEDRENIISTRLICTKRFDSKLLKFAWELL